MNLFQRFRRMLPDDPMIVAEVMAHNGDGSSTVQTPAGALLRVRGTDVAIGSNAYIQGGRILEAAPDFTVYNETV